MFKSFRHATEDSFFVKQLLTRSNWSFRMQRHRKIFGFRKTTVLTWLKILLCCHALHQFTHSSTFSMILKRNRPTAKIIIKVSKPKNQIVMQCSPSVFRYIDFFPIYLSILIIIEYIYQSIYRSISIKTLLNSVYKKPKGNKKTSTLAFTSAFHLNLSQSGVFLTWLLIPPPSYTL